MNLNRHKFLQSILFTFLQSNSSVQRNQIKLATPLHLICFYLWVKYVFGPYKYTNFSFQSL